MAIVKANAYGHGAVPVARALMDDVAMFGVANLAEAEELRDGGITAPILLLSACLPQEEEQVLRRSLHLCVSTREEAVALDALAARLGVKVHAHAVVDTGMGRMGFPEHAWDAGTIEKLLSLPHFIWEGIASHLPSPDEDVAFTRAQIATFARCVDTARVAGMQPRWVHTANSAGLLAYPEQRDVCNLVRPGLMLYGISPLPEHQPLLRPVLSWKTRITLIRELPPGHGVSYGRTFVTPRRTKVATLACGYADGFPRQVSGNGAGVLIRGQRCPVLGRVTMDQMMVDVTELAEPALVGDEAVLLGNQGTGSISAVELAQQAGTIAWHVFTGITTRVARCHG
jgi:alanine racemase